MSFGYLNVLYCKKIGERSDESCIMMNEFPIEIEETPQIREGTWMWEFFNCIHFSWVWEDLAEIIWAK